MLVVGTQNVALLCGLQGRSHSSTAAFESFVDSQNLHADESVDMVIFSPADYMRHAENIAEIHRNSADSLRVRVLDVTDVYNEFSSGAADVSGLRRYLKMLYDRRGRPESAVRCVMSCCWHA